MLTVNLDAATFIKRFQISPNTKINYYKNRRLNLDDLFKTY